MHARISVCVLAVAAALAACSPNEDAPRPRTPAQSFAPAAAAAAAPAVTGLPDFTALVKTQGPAVVNVVTSREVARGSSPVPPDHPLFEFFRRFAPEPPAQGAPGPQSRGIGSGFILSADGYILTNAHVVAGAGTVTVRLADARREFRGRVVGADARTDVALLKVDAADLPVARIGDSASLQAGEWVAAIGSPFGLANTITGGIVSALGRTLPVESFVPFIQTDVAVNPGNSGGPLLNMRGEVVGINSMIYSGSGGYMGVSFAIPIEVAVEVADQLRAHGRVTRGRLGIGIQALTPDLARSFRLAEANGVIVVSVEPGSPADKAGLRVGDVILDYGGHPIREASELPRRVAASTPGSTVALTVWRDRARHALKATVGETLPDPPLAQATGPVPAAKDDAPGLVVSELAEAERTRLGIEYGVRVERVENLPGTTAIQPGDVIVAVDGARFASVDEFQALLAQQRPGEPMALLVRRGPNALYVALPPPAQQRTG
jgi:serine protease Do